MIEHAHVVCPICESSKGWPLTFIDRATNEICNYSSGYCWRVCLSCGNAYPSIEPTLDMLQKYWNINRIEGGAGDSAEILERRLAYSNYWALKTYEFVTSDRRSVGQRFLDIACGLGATVKKFKDNGWYALGIDADPNTQKTHLQLGIDTIIGQFESIELNEQFDVISIAHAIYFVTQPKLFIQRVKDHLAPSGYFSVVVSDLTSTVGADYPSQVHTWFPTPKSLINALSLVGFRIIKRKRLGGSVLMLFQISESVPLPMSMLGGALSALLLKSHHLRYMLIGRPIVAGVRSIKKIYAVLSRRRY